MGPHASSDKACERPILSSQSDTIATSAMSSDLDESLASTSSSAEHESGEGEVESSSKASRYGQLPLYSIVDHEAFSHGPEVQAFLDVVQPEWEVDDSTESSTIPGLLPPDDSSSDGSSSSSSVDSGRTIKK